MRDTVRIWRRLLGRTYDAVNTNGPAQNAEECPVNTPGNAVCRFVKGKYNSKFFVRWKEFRVGALREIKYQKVQKIQLLITAKVIFWFICAAKFNSKTSIYKKLPWHLNWKYLEKIF